MEINEEWIPILDFLKLHHNFSFSASRLSNKFGISVFKMSKILYELYRCGCLDRRTRGSKKKKSFYKFKMGIIR